MLRFACKQLLKGYQLKKRGKLPKSTQNVTVYYRLIAVLVLLPLFCMHVFGPSVLGFA